MLFAKKAIFCGAESSTTSKSSCVRSVDEHSVCIAHRKRYVHEIHVDSIDSCARVAATKHAARDQEPQWQMPRQECPVNRFASSRHIRASAKVAH